MRDIDSGSAGPDDDAPAADQGGSAPRPSRISRVRRWSTSIPVLAGALIVFTFLAAGPLQGMDLALHQSWSDFIVPSWRPFIENVLDPIAGQAVAVPILGIIAVCVSLARRSWRPFLVACLAEFLVVGFVGAFKVVMARPSPELGDPGFFNGGLLKDAWLGISYPSGHASEAVLLYGIMVYLLVRYGYLTRHAYRVLVLVVVLITVMTVVDSFYLGWHWATDLIGGVMAGGLVLRVTVWADAVIPTRIIRAVRYSKHDKVRRLARYLET